MSSQHAKRDRRRHPRVTCPATMHVYCGTRPAGRFSVRNLSAGGALIGPEAPLEPCVAEDVLYTRARGQLDADILFETEKAVRVVLELPGMDAVPLRAHVVRLDHDRAGGPTVALAFSHDHPDTEDIIQDAVQVIRYGAQPAIDGREGRRTVALLEAIYRSAREGRKAPFECPAD